MSYLDIDGLVIDEDTGEVIEERRESAERMARETGR